jgi:Asp-tRNA(Asn)/Glu-tRNA(Gln) amidotransferase A subunit family amidase
VQVDPQVQALVAQAVQRLARLGAQVEEVDLASATRWKPSTPCGLPARRG